MGIYDLTGAILAKYDLVRILMYLLIIECCFPISIIFYKSHGVKLQNEFFADNKYFTDIVLGVAAALASFIVSFIIVHIIFRTPVYRYTNYNILWLNIMAYVFISGICKEVYYRGVPFKFLRDEIGEWPAFLVANVCFTILDWTNIGLYNLLCLLTAMGTFSFLGIIPK